MKHATASGGPVAGYRIAANEKSAFFGDTFGGGPNYRACQSVCTVARGCGCFCSSAVVCFILNAGTVKNSFSPAECIKLGANRSSLQLLHCCV